MTFDELNAIVEQATRAGEWPVLVERMRHLDDDKLFRLLFPLATSAQWDCPLAFSAALLLYEIKPACPIPCEEAVRMMLGSWEVSIEEVPWYLEDVFGRLQMLESIAQLLRESLGEDEIRHLQTIEYWLDVPASERRIEHPPKS